MNSEEDAVETLKQVKDLHNSAHVTRLKEEYGVGHGADSPFDGKFGRLESVIHELSHFRTIFPDSRMIPDLSDNLERVFGLLEPHDSDALEAKTLTVEFLVFQMLGIDLTDSQIDTLVRFAVYGLRKQTRIWLEEYVTTYIGSEMLLTLAEYVVMDLLNEPR
jgi:hypothetical protein